MIAIAMAVIFVTSSIVTCSRHSVVCMRHAEIVRERARRGSCTVRALELVRPASLSAAQEVLARNQHPDPEVRRGRRREGSRRVSRTYIACRKRQVDRWRNNWPLISRANLKESERDGVRKRGRELKLAQLYRWVRGGLRRNYK